MKCSVAGCDRSGRIVKDMCLMHYDRVRRTGTSEPPHTPTLEERFWPRVNKTATCWLWTGTLFSGTGYGVFHIERKPRLAHRVAYELVRGSIPDGFQLDHLCRVRACVNPEHLEAVTYERRMGRPVDPTVWAKCRHPKTPENTSCPNSNPRCATCRRASNRRSVAR